MSNLAQINRAKHAFDKYLLITIIKGLVFSKMFYCSSVYGQILPLLISISYRLFRTLLPAWWPDPENSTILHRSLNSFVGCQLKTIYFTVMPYLHLSAWTVWHRRPTFVPDSSRGAWLAAEHKPGTRGNNKSAIKQGARRGTTGHGLHPNYIEIPKCGVISFDKITYS